MVCTLLSHISSCHCGSDMPVYNVFLHKLTSSESNESKISIRSDLWNGKLSSTLTGIVKVRGFLPCVLKNGEIGMSQDSRDNKAEEDSFQKSCNFLTRLITQEPQLVCAYVSIGNDHVQADYYYFFGKCIHLALALLLSAENELSHVSSLWPWIL